MSGIPAGAGGLLGKRLGKYEILALLALGGTAEIYLARIGGAAGFEKYVVVKCLHDHLADDQEFVKMFLDEARLAAHLDHSNIVQTMELGEHEDRYYMVMEFLAGLSLAMIVRRAGERLPNGRLPVPMSLNILAQSCAGLHYAHEKAMNGKALNIVHRDISPQNLVVSFEGVVKVVDFGIAKAELRETKTRSGTIKGKFAYMSPEQCIATNVDRRTDVFALGVIAWELLTGRRLFKKPSPYETYQAVIECAVPPPSKLNVELDPALDPVIMKSIAKDKENRYPTAEAFGDALLGYLHHRGKGSGPGDVSRFFDTTFAQEIEEHGARMRELISGRDADGGELVKWEAEEEEDKKRNETVDLGGKGTDSVDLDSMDILDPERASASGLSGVIDQLGGSSRDDGDDDMPAERTRIESNPLEQVARLDQMVEKQKTPAPQLLRGNTPAPERKTPAPALRGKTPAPERKTPSPVIRAPGGRAKTPAPALVPTEIAELDPPTTKPQPRMPSGPLPLPAPPTSPGLSSGAPGKPSSGKFPDMANLPTMVAEPEAEGSPELAPTALGALPIDPATGKPDVVDPMGRTGLEMQPPNLNGVRVSPPVAPSNRPNSVPPLPQQTAPQPGQPAQPTAPPQNFSYPVMNAELRDQIATGASVFPSPPGGRPSVQGPPDSGPQHVHPHQEQPRQEPPPQQQPQYPQYSQYPQHPQHPHDSSRAAELASPVGAHYGDNVDWAAAAAQPAKAIPPWMLAILFVGALGVALTITILIARMIR